MLARVACASNGTSGAGETGTGFESPCAHQHHSGERGRGAETAQKRRARGVSTEPGGGADTTGNGGAPAARGRGHTSMPQHSNSKNDGMRVLGACDENAAIPLANGDAAELRERGWRMRVREAIVGKTSGRGLCVIGGVIAVLLGMAPYAGASTRSAGPTPQPSVSRISNSVVPAVANGQLQSTSTPASAANQQLTLTLTLNRTDQSGFDSYLAEVQDTASPRYHRFLTQAELADTFGPSRSAYDSVLAWLHSQGFADVEGSANRLTITVKGTRAQVSQAFDTRITNYRVGDRSVYANAQDPALPQQIASDVQSVSGLSNVASPNSNPARAAHPTSLVQNHLGACANSLADIGISLGITAAILLLAPFVLAILELVLGTVFSTTEAAIWGYGAATANTLLGLFPQYPVGVSIPNIANDFAQCIFQLRSEIRSRQLRELQWREYI